MNTTATSVALAIALAAPIAHAGEAPRQVNAWVRVVNAPAPQAQIPAADSMGGPLDSRPHHVLPDGSGIVDLGGQFALGISGHIDADGQLHSECSDRPAALRQWFAPSALPTQRR